VEQRLNRRGFISPLAGAAGAPLVPWRGLIDPVIVPPTRKAATLPFGFNPYTYQWSWVSGGSGLAIVSPFEAETAFAMLDSRRASGVAQCEITDSLGRRSVARVNVEITVPRTRILRCSAVRAA
jgi:hypothetical protein